ncbi:MAG: hypothetical protein OEY64_03215 [Nitrospinota bacterium]|nr:hypothetical protein [Nitrospinota bacterium]
MDIAVIVSILKPIIASALSGMGAGFIISMKKLVKEDRPERFNLAKLFSTGAVGMLLGVLAYAQGYDLTMANYDSYLAANALAVMMAQSVWEFGVRIYDRWKSGKAIL